MVQEHFHHRVLANYNIKALIGKGCTTYTAHFSRLSHFSL